MNKPFCLKCSDACLLSHLDERWNNRINPFGTFCLKERLYQHLLASKWQYMNVNTPYNANNDMQCYRIKTRIREWMLGFKKSVFLFKRSKMHVSVFSFHSGDGVHCGLQPVGIYWESLSALQVNWLPFLLLSTLISCFSVIKVFLLICNMRLLYNSQFQELDTQPFVWFISLENQMQLGEKFGVCSKKGALRKGLFQRSSEVCFQCLPHFSGLWI